MNTTAANNVLNNVPLAMQIFSYLPDDTVQVLSDNGHFRANLGLTVNGNSILVNSALAKISMICKSWKEAADFILKNSLKDLKIQAFDRIKGQNPYWFSHFTNFVTLQTGIELNSWGTAEKLECITLIVDRTIALANNPPVRKEELSGEMSKLTAGWTLIKALNTAIPSNTLVSSQLEVDVVANKVLGFKYLASRNHRYDCDYADSRLESLISASNISEKMEEITSNEIRKAPTCFLEVTKLRGAFNTNLSILPMEATLCKNLTSVTFEGTSQPTPLDIKTWLEHFPALKSISSSRSDLVDEQELSALKELASRYHLWIEVHSEKLAKGDLHTLGPYNYHAKIPNYKEALDNADCLRNFCNMETLGQLIRYLRTGMPLHLAVSMLKSLLNGCLTIAHHRIKSSFYKGLYQTYDASENALKGRITPQSALLGFLVLSVISAIVVQILMKRNT